MKKIIYYKTEIIFLEKILKNIIGYKNMIDSKEFSFEAVEIIKTYNTSFNFTKLKNGNYILLK